MNKLEVIVAVGAEGGSVTLYGARTISGWIFSRHVLDQTPLMLDEPCIEEKTEFLDSWRAALESLSEYSWVDLHPLEAHPEFHQRIFDVVLETYAKRVNPSGRHLELWKEICCGQNGK